MKINIGLSWGHQVNFSAKVEPIELMFRLFLFVSVKTLEGCMNRKKRKTVGSADLVVFLIRGELFPKLSIFKNAQFKNPCS